MSKRILIIAGEASGDIHGAHLVEHLLSKDAHIRLVGVGGEKMRKAGVTLYADAHDLGVVGFWEILPKLGRIWSVYRHARSLIQGRRVDLVLLIDYPGLNIRIAGIAKKFGIPVIYYISPQVWAWKAGRIRTLAERVTKMIVIFPFEKEIYRNAGLACEFVGHPLVDEVASYRRQESGERTFAMARKDFGLDPSRPVIGLFPGSRIGEVSALLKLFVSAAESLHAALPQAQFLLALAPTLTQDKLESIIGRHLPFPIHWIEGDANGALSVCDAVMAASGTITLQAALYEKPMVIVYRVSPVTYRLAQRLVQIDHIGLPNIVAGSRIVPELVQDDATPRAIAEEVLRFFQDPPYADRVRDALRKVNDQLGAPGASERAAQIVLDCL